MGRDADMETLEAALAQAQAGNGQVVGVVAEAGTRKSRLCFECLERLKARGEEFRDYLPLLFVSLTGNVPESSERNTARLDACSRFLHLAWRSGMSDAVERVFRTGLDLAERSGNPEAALAMRSRYDEQTHPELAASNGLGFGFTLYTLGDLAAEAMEVARRIGSPFSLTLAHLSVGIANLMERNVPAATEALTEAVEVG